MEPVGRFGLAFGRLLHRHAERLDQLAVLHARGTGRLAGAAVEAQLQVPAHFAGQLQAAIGHRAHQIDAAARAVVLVPQLHIRRAAGRAQAAVDAIEKQLVVDARARVALGLRGRRMIGSASRGAGRLMGVGRIGSQGGQPLGTGGGSFFQSCFAHDAP